MAESHHGLTGEAAWDSMRPAVRSEGAGAVTRPTVESLRTRQRQRFGGMQLLPGLMGLLTAIALGALLLGAVGLMVDRFGVDTARGAGDSLTRAWSSPGTAELWGGVVVLGAVELLSLPLRSKGMGLYNIFQGCAGLVQSYGIGVGIGKLGYKIWVVYIVYNMIQLVLAYYLFPETSKLSLEEIDSIFETPGEDPVKMSLKIESARKERERLEREGADVTA